MSADLPRRNAEVFRTRFPEAWHLVADHRPDPGLRLTGRGAAVSVLAHGTDLYPGGAAHHAAAQVEAFVRRPVEAAAAEEPWHVVARHMNAAETALFGALDALADRPAAEDASGPEPPAAYFLLVLGAGLGHPLEALVERHGCRHLLVVEPFLDLLRLGLTVFDWGRFLARAEARGVRVHLFAGPDLEPAAAAVLSLMRRDCPAAAHGLRVFRHMVHPAFDRFLERVLGDPFFFSGWGYFDDEAALLANAVTNIGARPGLRLLAPDPRAATAAATAAARRGTAIVVGSGPSLSGRLDALRAVQGRAAIVSCGSALRPLLQAGIRPSLHVEKEREPWRLAFLDQLDLTGVPQALPITVVPRYLERVADDDAALYVRPGGATGALLDGRARFLRAPGEKVDHIAVMLMAAAGARRIVLAGIDLGTRDPASHHADGVFPDPAQWAVLGDPAHARLFDFRHRAPGNLGGTVYASSSQVTARQAHEAVIRAFPDIAWANASDGVRIEGAAALARLDDGLGDGPGGGPGGGGGLPPRLAGFFADRAPRLAGLDRAGLAALLRAAAASAETHRLAPVLTAAAPDPGGPERVAEAVCGFLGTSGLHSLHRRLLFGQVQHALYFFRQARRRAAAAGRGPAADRAFLDGLAPVVGGYEARTRTLLPDLAARLDGGG